LLVTAEIAWAQLRQVEDLRCPGPGITKIRLEQRFDDHNYRPTFIGDVDGDGFEDFLILQTYDSDGTSASRSLLVYGQANYPQEASLADLRTTTLLHELHGTLSMAGSLTPYAAAGDVNQDGHADFFVGSPGTDWNGVTLSGHAILVFGSADFGSEVSLNFPASPGVRVKRFISRAEGEIWGWVIAPVGDLDSDGFPDLAISTPMSTGAVNGREFAGSVYLIFGGPTSSSEEDVFLEDIGGSIRGFLVRGAYGHEQASGHNNGDLFGYSLIGPGDLDGDGKDDVVVSAPNASRGGRQERGAVYIVYGKEGFSQELSIAAPGDIRSGDSWSYHASVFRAEHGFRWRC
jgi:hypothetical protein